MILAVLLISIAVSVRSQDVGHLPGDVEIGGLFSIRGNSQGKCAEVSPVSVQLYEAAKWACKFVNEQNYLPGFTLGIRALPTCSVTGEAVKVTMEFLDCVTKEQNSTVTCTTPLVGIVGPEHSSEVVDTSTLISSLAGNDHLLQMAFSATAESLADQNKFRNLKRVIPSDKTQIKAIIALMKQLEWNYVSVVYENSTYGMEAFQEFHSQAAKAGICIPYHTALKIGMYGELNPSDLNLIMKDVTQYAESPITGMLVIGGSKTARSILTAAHVLRQSYIFELAFIFSEGVQLGNDVFVDNNQIMTFSRGSFLASPPRIIFPTFSKHWGSIFRYIDVLKNETQTNPWLRDVYRDFHSCSLPDLSNCPVSQDVQKKSEFQSKYVGYVIQSVLSFAKAIKIVHGQICSSETGLCENLKKELKEVPGSLIDTIETMELQLQQDFPSLGVNVDAQFSKSVDAKQQTSVDYNIYHHRKCSNSSTSFCYEKVGSLNNSVLQLRTDLLRDYSQNTDINDNGRAWPNLLRSQCSEENKCTSCIQDSIHDEVYYKDGDLFVAGLVPIFDKSSNDPTACGSIRKTLGTELAEAMAYGVALVNEKQGKYSSFFPDKRIGFVIINTCNQVVRAQKELLNMLNSGVRLSNGSTVYIRDKLLGLVAAYGSGISAATSDILSKFNIVQVSYASTAAVLSDRVSYPYFLRTPTPDDKQAKAMMQMVKDLNSNYVQLLYSADTYGEGGRNDLKNEAKRLQVCIANEVRVLEGQYNTILQDMRKYPYAKIVILFLRSHVVHNVIDTIYSSLDAGEFVFIGSEAWSDRMDIITNRQYLAGSFSLSLKMTEDPGFQTYLRGINVSSATANPWLKTYFEEKYNCYLHGSFNKKDRSKCSTTQLAASTTYQQDLWTPFALNAMLALLSGTNEAFSSLCGAQSEEICRDYRETPTTVYESVKKQELPIDDTGVPQRIFSDNGDGNVGYRIYQVQKEVNDPSMTEYVQVGRATLSSDGYRFDSHRLDFPYNGLPSLCPNDRACAKCFQVTETTPGPETAMSSKTDSSVTIAMGVVIGVLVVVIIVLVVLGVCKLQRDNVQSGRDPQYIDAIPDDINRDYIQTELGHRTNTGYVTESDSGGMDSIPSLDRFREDVRV